MALRRLCIRTIAAPRDQEVKMSGSLSDILFSVVLVLILISDT
jgi:hypothetical protein